jgi:hypothetical protein
MADKKRFDYSKIGLIKKDDITTYDGKGLEQFSVASILRLANYGLFTILTRSLAGHEKETNEEKKEILTETFDGLVNETGRKRGKVAETPEEKDARIKAETIARIRESVKNGTAAEKKMAEQIISKL